MKLTDHMTTLHRGDPAYPARLEQIPDPPSVLYVAGSAGVLDRPLVAIVGTRRCTQDAGQIAFDFAAELARRGIGIVSGLAYGIDAAAHRGALSAGGVTIGVLAAGLDPVYPGSHAELASRIIKKGAVISEFDANQEALKYLFPRRNRIISGLSLGVLVVEAPERSGALITARLAGEQGREVFVPPASLTNLRAAGIHKLIEDGVTVVTGPQQILDAIAPSAEEFFTPPQAAAIPLPADAETLLHHLTAHPQTIDDLSLVVSVPPVQLLRTLTILEMAGRVRQTPGRGFVRA